MPGLDFIPRNPSRSLFPRCLWRAWALNHFDAGDEIATQDLSALSLDQALFQIYSSLSFAELARLYVILLQKGLSEDFAKIAVVFGYGYDQRLIDAIDIYNSLSADLQAWADQHSLSPRELLPLGALDVVPMDLLQPLADAKVSRNYGAQILELLVENLLLEHPQDILMPHAPLTSAAIPAWIERLKALRFPETLARDNSKEEKLSSLPWTKDFQTRWQRKGDQSGLEIKFTVSSKKDLQLKLESLERVLQSYQENSSD